MPTPMDREFGGKIMSVRSRKITTSDYIREELGYMSKAFTLTIDDTKNDLNYVYEKLKGLYSKLTEIYKS